MKISESTKQIVEANEHVLAEFFIGIASGEYYDGISRQLYLDTQDNTLAIYTEASANTWRQRSDGSLHQIKQVSGYSDLSEEDLYTDGCDLDDYGYSYFLEDVTEEIELILNNAI